MLVEHQKGRKHLGILKVREINFFSARHGRRRGIAPRISNFDSRQGRSAVKLMTRSPYTREKTPALSGPQSRFRQFGEEKISYFYRNLTTIPRLSGRLI